MPKNATGPRSITTTKSVPVAFFGMSTRRGPCAALVLAALCVVDGKAPIIYFAPEETKALGEDKMLEASGNWFKVNDEVKLLPEVMSVLDFSPKDHATPGDAREEAE